MPRPEYMVANGDVRIAVRDYGGQGPDLLLTHGAGDNLRSLGGLIPLLRPHHRVVAFDLRGHGWSDESPSWSAHDLVSDAETIVAALALDNPFMAGHSLGGIVAAFYGQAHPECPGVANIDGHPKGQLSLAPDIRQRFQAVLDAEDAARKPEADSGDAAWLEAQLAERRAQTDAMGIPWSAAEGNARRNFVVESDGRYHRRPSAHWRRIYTAASASWSMFDVYRRVQCPLLLFDCQSPNPALEPDIQEAMDASLADELARLVADRPATQIATMAADHGVIYEDPAGCARHLLGFFAR